MRRCRISQLRVIQTRPLWFALVWVTLLAAHALPTEPDKLLPDWDRALTLRAAGGFKDNIGLSHLHPESSPFFRSTLEAAVLQLPTDSHQFSFIATGEDTRYVSARNVDHEDFALARGEYRRFWANDWQAALAVEGFYLDQVLDLSATEANTNAFPVRGGGAGLRPSLRRDVTEQVWLNLELGVTRQFFSRPLDDYWELGPKLTLGRTYGNESEISAFYEFLHRAYDDERARDAAGNIVTNGVIRAAFQHEFGLVWKHFWDGARHWRSTTKAGFQHSEDNASGYFDYHRYQGLHQLRYLAAPWEASVEGRIMHYEFPVQTISAASARHRRRWDLVLAARVERQFGRHLRLLAEYEYQRSDSNLVVDEYAVNTLSGGVSWEF